MKVNDNKDNELSKEIVKDIKWISVFHWWTVHGIGRAFIWR